MNVFWLDSFLPVNASCINCHHDVGWSYRVGGRHVAGLYNRRGGAVRRSRWLASKARAWSCNFPDVALSSKLSFGCSSIFALLAISACSGPVRVSAAGPILWRSPSRSAGRRWLHRLLGEWVSSPGSILLGLVFTFAWFLRQLLWCLGSVSYNMFAHSI